MKISYVKILKLRSKIAIEITLATCIGRSNWRCIVQPSVHVKGNISRLDLAIGGIKGVDLCAVVLSGWVAHVLSVT